MSKIHLYVYILDGGYIRCKKRVWSHRTPQSSCFLYSNKTRQYHEALIYYMNASGEAIQTVIIDRQQFRAALMREGLDLR